MAANIVGDAYVVVRAITSSVEGDIRKAFSGADKEGDRLGDNVSRGFKRGFNRGNRKGFNLFSPSTLAQADAAGKKFQSLTRLGYFLAPAITAVSGAIGVVGTGLISLVSVIGAAAGPALVTLAGAFTAVGQAALTAKLAFSGVAKAIQAGNKAAKTSVADKKAEERLSKALVKAQKALAKAYEDAAESNALATRAVTDAENEYADALARAREELQQLAFESEDAALNEQKAALELEKARETLARVSDLPPNSRARKEAELAFAEADLNYRRAIDANNDLKKQEAENAALGPDLETQAAKQKDVLRSLRDLDDARKNETSTILDNQQAILDATEARDEAAQAKADFDKEKASATAYADALSDLSDEAQSFVKYIVSLKEEFKGLKDAAGEKLFPQLETAIGNLVTNLFPTIKPLLTETGDALGKIAVKISETITTTENLERLKSIWETNNNFILDLGDATANLYEVFLILLDAAGPLIEEFGDWLVTITNTWKETLKAEEASGKLADKFEIAKNILKDLGTIFGNTFRGLGNIISENVGPGSGGQIFLDYLKDVTKKFEELDTIDGKSLKEFFADAAVNGTKLLDLLGNIVGGFITLADNPELGIFFDQLGVVADTFQRVGENLSGSLPAFGEFLIQFSELFAIITEAGSITIFFDTLSTVLKGLNTFLKSELGQSILSVTSKILPVIAALGLVAQIIKFGLLVILKGLVNTLWLLDKVFKVISFTFKLVAGAFRLLGIAFAANPIGFIITAVVALIAALVILYNKNEAFRELVQKVWGAIKDAIAVAVDFVKAYFEKLIEIGSKLWEPILSGLKFIWDAVKAYFEIIFTVWKTIAEIFIGIGLTIWNFLYDKIVAVWETVSGWWNNTILPFITGIVDKVKEFGAKIWDWVFDKISAVWNKVKGFWDQTIYPFVDKIIDRVVRGAGKIWDFISNALSAVWDKVKGFWDNTIYPFISGIKTRISNIASNLWDGLKNGLQGVVNFIIRGVNLVIKGINLLIRAANRVKIGKDIPEVNEILPVNFAKGGVVYPSSGGTIARVAEAGRPERIEPLDPQGLSVRDRAIITELAKEAGIGNQVNITVNPSEGMDERELAAIVARQISYSLRMGAA